MQNVHVMRPEVRAAYDAAREIVSGDDAFDVRFERSFTELRDPLVALYGSDPRFAAAWPALLQAIAPHRGRALAGAQAARSRARDHPRLAAP